MSDDQEQLAHVADAIVEMYRKVYELDLNIDEAYTALWHEQKAQGVSWETFQAAKELARPHCDELFMDYTRRFAEAARERFFNPDEPTG